MSGVGITQEGSEEREYCFQVFNFSRPKVCEIHFVVTRNTAAHLSAVKNEYEKKGATLHSQQLVEFEIKRHSSSMITLNIPLEGIAIQGWKITPILRPVVTKQQVDNFREGKLIPHCQLKAEVIGKREEVSSLQHNITLSGANYPHNILTIDLPAAKDLPH